MRGRRQGRTPQIPTIGCWYFYLNRWCRGCAWWAARPDPTHFHNWVLELLLGQVVPRVCVCGAAARPHPANSHIWVLLLLLKQVLLRVCVRAWWPRLHPSTTHS